MHELIWFATLVVLVGGIMEGSFALPMRFARHWAWENIWMAYSLIGLIVIPWIAASVSVPALVDAYKAVPLRTLGTTALFGLGWGIANVLFGLAVPIVGIALSIAIIVGMSAALGSLIPLVLSDPGRLLKPTGWMIIAGVVLTTLGVTLLGVAGRAREKAQADTGRSMNRSRRSMTFGLGLCILGGLLAPMLNFSFAFGSQIIKQAVAQGAKPANAVNAVWAIALAGGFLSNGGYCAILLIGNRTWSRFLDGRSRSHWVLGAMMAVLWTGGVLLYGWGASSMGDLGSAIGWPVFQATTVVASSVIGAAAGEWKNTPYWIVRTNTMGLAALVLAIAVLSVGNRI
jgi:L-rhamnose-H+ transport protein